MRNLCRKLQCIIIDLHPVSNLDKSPDHGMSKVRNQPIRVLASDPGVYGIVQATDEWFNVNKFSLIQLQFYTSGPITSDTLHMLARISDFLDVYAVTSKSKSMICPWQLWQHVSW